MQTASRLEVVCEPLRRFLEHEHLAAAVYSLLWLRRVEAQFDGTIVATLVCHLDHGDAFQLLERGVVPLFLPRVSSIICDHGWIFDRHLRRTQQVQIVVATLLEHNLHASVDVCDAHTTGMLADSGVAIAISHVSDVCVVGYELVGLELADFFVMLFVVRVLCLSCLFISSDARAHHDSLLSAQRLALTLFDASWRQSSLVLLWMLVYLTLGTQVGDNKMYEVLVHRVVQIFLEVVLVQRTYESFATSSGLLFIRFDNGGTLGVRQNLHRNGAFFFGVALHSVTANKQFQFLRQLHLLLVTVSHRRASRRSTSLPRYPEANRAQICSEGFQILRLIY